MKFEVDGLKEMSSSFDKARKTIADYSTEEVVSFDVMFDIGFMTQHTPFSSFEDFMTASGFKIESQEDFEGILGVEFDEFISSRTEFSSWDAMLSKAGEEYMADKISKLFK